MNMNQENNREKFYRYESIARLNNDADFQNFIGLLKNEREKLVGHMIAQREDIELRVLQGRIQQIDDILDKIKNARATKEKLRSNTSQ